MPDIALRDPNGETRALSDLRGQVVLDFWASWWTSPRTPMWFAPTRPTTTAALKCSASR